MLQLIHSKIGYNHRESPAMVAGATPSGKSRLNQYRKTSKGQVDVRHA
jgi:hypothetical protein